MIRSLKALRFLLAAYVLCSRRSDGFIVDYNTSCTDSGQFACAEVDVAFGICKDIQHAKIHCRKYCGVCDVVDGNWSTWSEWSLCDVTCGNGTLRRTRTCTNPTPAHGGTNCSGFATENKMCTQSACPIHGGWSFWEPWGQCSVSCGIGLQRRERSCSNPYPDRFGDHCFGDAHDDEICILKACIDGGWSTWSTWGTCSNSCDSGLRTRTRHCDNPEPSLLGNYCPGVNLDTELCNKQPCQYPAYYPSVAFSADYDSHQIPTSGDTMVFTSVKYNSGNAYDNITGIFTAPVPGLYLLTTELYGEYPSIITTSIVIGGKEKGRAFYIPFVPIATPDFGSGQVTVLMKKGETALVRWVNTFNEIHLHGSTRLTASFSGLLVTNYINFIPF